MIIKKKRVKKSLFDLSEKALEIEETNKNILFEIKDCDKYLHTDFIDDRIIEIKEHLEELNKILERIKGCKTFRI